VTHVITDRDNVKK